MTIHDFLPAVRAGSELYTYNLARELQRSGVAVELLHAARGDRAIRRTTYDGISCTVIYKPLRHYQNLFEEEDAWADQAFLECVEQFRPDVLHVNHLLHLSTNIPKLAKARNIPVIFTMHDYWIACPRMTLLDSCERLCESTTTAKCTRCCRALYSRFSWDSPDLKPADLLGCGKFAVKTILSTVIEAPEAYRRMLDRARSMKKLTDYVSYWIAPSRFLFDKMLKWGLPKERIILLPNGNNKQLFRKPARKSENCRLRFAYLGTIARHKGIHVLLEAFRGFTDADLFIYGSQDWSLYADYRDVLAQGNVWLKGVITDEQKAQLFSETDALIVPSIWYENAPVTIQEAFLASVPVICSDIGGMKEMVRNGETGLYFRRGSAEDLRRIIQACCEEPIRLRGLRPSAEDVPGLEYHVRTGLLPLYRMVKAEANRHTEEAPRASQQGSYRIGPSETEAASRQAR